MEGRCGGGVSPRNFVLAWYGSGQHGLAMGLGTRWQEVAGCMSIAPFVSLLWTSVEKHWSFLCISYAKIMRRLCRFLTGFFGPGGWLPMCPLPSCPLSIPFPFCFTQLSSNVVHLFAEPTSHTHPHPHPYTLIYTHPHSSTLIHTHPHTSTHPPKPPSSICFRSVRSRP